MFVVRPSFIPNAARGVFYEGKETFPTRKILPSYYHGYRQNRPCLSSLETQFLQASGDDSPPVIGFCVPKKANHCMQICNDPGHIDLSDFPFGQDLSTQLHFLLQKAKDYGPSIAKANVSVVPVPLVIDHPDHTSTIPLMSTKELAPGDECLSSYGIMYWLSRSNPDFQTWKDTTTQEFVEIHRARILFLILVHVSDQEHGQSIQNLRERRTLSDVITGKLSYPALESELHQLRCSAIEDTLRDHMKHFENHTMQNADVIKATVQNLDWCADFTPDGLKIHFI